MRRAFIIVGVFLVLLTNYSMANASSPAELMNFKSGPLNQCRPMNLSTLVETLASWHSQLMRGARPNIPCITVQTSGRAYTGYLLQVDSTAGEKTIIMATVSENDRFPSPGIAYVRLDSIQGIIFPAGEQAPIVQK